MPKSFPPTAGLPLAGLAIALALAGCGKPQSERKLDQLDAQLLANQADPALTGKLADQIVVDPARTAAAPAKPAPAKTVAARTAGTTAAAAPASAAPPAKATASAPAMFAKVPPPIAPASPPGTTLGALASAQAAAGPVAPPHAPQGAATAAAKPPVASKAPAAAVPANAGPVRGECYADLDYAAKWAGKLPAALPLYPGATLREAAGNEQAGCAIRVVSFTTPAAWHDVADWYRARAAKAGWSADETVRGGDHVVAGTAPDGSAFYLMLAGTGAKGTAADMIVSLGH